MIKWARHLSWFIIVADFCHSLCSLTALLIIIIEARFCHNLRSLGYKLWEFVMIEANDEK